MKTFLRMVIFIGVMGYAGSLGFWYVMPAGVLMYSIDLYLWEKGWYNKSSR